MEIAGLCLPLKPQKESVSHIINGMHTANPVIELNLF